MNKMADEKTLDAVQQNARETAEAFSALANALSQRSEFSPLAQRARRRAAELETNKFTVMLVGEFKRGKSTVLNALLGSDALPRSVVPCTAVVTFVRHGPQPEVQVAFSDARNPNPERFSLVEFNKKYRLNVQDTTDVTDRFAEVDHAVLLYPSPFVENGVEIVDTPGLNEHDVRTKRVLGNLPAADAVIMVLDATTVANQKEIEFIENRLRPLGLHKHVFFLLNGWNLLRDKLLDPNDPKAIEETFREQNNFINTRLVPFASAAGSDKIDKRIFKVDALGALRYRLSDPKSPLLEQTEIPAFERCLREFLTVDRDAARRDKDRSIAEDIAQDVTGNTSALIRLAREPISNFAVQQSKLEAQISQLERIRISIVTTITSYAAETARTLSETLEAYLEENLYARLADHVDQIDLGEVDSIWMQWKALADPLRADENKVSKRIESALTQQVADLVGRQLDGWREMYLEPELTQRASELKQQLKHEAGEYIKVLEEIQSGESRTGQISDESIARKISEWGRDYRTDFTTIAAGAGFDLAPLVAGIMAEVVLHIAITAMTLGISLALTGIFAVVRKEYHKNAVKKQIVKALEDRKKELLLEQKVQLQSKVMQAFKDLSEPISQSIESEIAVIKASMTDVLQQKQKADFDAVTFEKEVRGIQTLVERRVSDVRRLVA
jgi:hypothetical protein